MIYNGQEIPFPAVMHVSFVKLIEHLEAAVKNGDESAAYAKELLLEVEKYPELKEGITDPAALSNYQDSIEKLSKPLFPEVLSGNEIKILTPPFYFQPLYTSKRFDRIVEASGELFSFTMRDVDADTFYLYCCYFILGSYFGFPASTTTPQLLEIFNRDQQQMRVYKLLINADMCEFVPTENAVMITRKDYEELMDNFSNIELWKKKFPQNSWIMRGLNIVNLVDVTADQSIGAITSNLLVKSTESFQNIQSGIKRLLNDANLSIGVLSFDRNQLIGFQDAGVSSILLKQGESLHSREDLCDYSFSQLMDKKEPLIITDTQLFYERGKSKMSEKLLETGFKSYMVVPVVHERELMGFLEMGSTEKYALHEGILALLEDVLPILAMAKKRFKTEAQNLIEAVIQQECTTIHPSVKWRFEEQAREFIEKQAAGEQAVFKDIVFEKLYPLYGQVDIKGSSERRNEAVSKDLKKQLKSVLKVLKEANMHNPMPIYEELMYRSDSFLNELDDELAAGSEHTILTFIKEEVYPVFDYLKTQDNVLRQEIDRYYKSLDPLVNTVYEARKAYDESVNLINQKLAAYLDEKQVEAQAMFPHYFERYKTDGVEFNMYIGQSITRQEVFDKLYLRNLRIWQLLMMCEMENQFRVLNQQLDSTIEVASLVLVYNTPISVHFRMDEKKFDVEGAYNARYEIIKKRVDKAHIKGTDERITQPGKLVIVYAQESDAREYRTYLKFLAAKGYLQDRIEDVPLEDLQGVVGLRALRVAVAYEGNMTVDELIREMEATSDN